MTINLFSSVSLASVPVTLYANICKLQNISDATYKYCISNCGVLFNILFKTILFNNINKAQTICLY